MEMHEIPTSALPAQSTPEEILQRTHEQQQHEEVGHGAHDSGWLLLEMDVAENPNNSTPLRTP
jgi:hypothetical protein